MPASFQRISSATVALRACCVGGIRGACRCSRRCCWRWRPPRPSSSRPWRPARRPRRAAARARRRCWACCTPPPRYWRWRSRASPSSTWCRCGPRRGRHTAVLCLVPRRPHAGGSTHPSVRTVPSSASTSARRDPPEGPRVARASLPRRARSSSFRPARPRDCSWACCSAPPPPAWRRSSSPATPTARCARLRLPARPPGRLLWESPCPVRRPRTLAPWQC